MNDTTKIFLMTSDSPWLAVKRYLPAHNVRCKTKYFPQMISFRNDIPYSVTGVKTPVTLTGLRPATTDAFQVRSLGKSGYSDWSDSATLMCTQEVGGPAPSVFPISGFAPS